LVGWRRKRTVTALLLIVYKTKKCTEYKTKSGEAYIYADLGRFCMSKTISADSFSDAIAIGCLTSSVPSFNQGTDRCMKIIGKAGRLVGKQTTWSLLF
jgi:hypothetical protein